MIRVVTGGEQSLESVYQHKIFVHMLSHRRVMHGKRIGGTYDVGVNAIFCFPPGNPSRLPIATKRAIPLGNAVMTLLCFNLF